MPAHLDTSTNKALANSDAKIAHDAHVIAVDDAMLHWRAT